LASASGNDTVRLWDTATGATLQTLEGYESIEELSFSGDGRYLETNRGLLYLQSSSVHAPPEAQHSDTIFANANWVTRDGKNLLWLPPNSRGTCSAFRRNLLVLGQASGRVIFIAFSFS
jgi:WD40 repeat protein